MGKHRPKVWFVGGETGGHVVPLLAVADRLNAAITFVGSKGGIEERLAKRHGYPFMAIPSGKFRRSWNIGSIIKNCFDGVQFGCGVVWARWQIFRHRPALIFSKGGPVALPVVLAGWLAGTPIITHESDIVMGRSNRLIARLAERVLTGFPVTLYPYVEATKLIQVGIPLRRQFCSPHKSSRAKGRPMVLFTGGSAGAASVGEVLLATLPRLLPEVDVMHICGPTLVKSCAAAKSALPADVGEHYSFVAYTDDIADYIRAATVVVTRGSSQLFEIASLNRAMISIPLPWAANNHQVKNSEYFAARSAAIMLRQEGLTPDRLYNTIKMAVDDNALRHKLEQSGSQFNSCASAKQVADIIVNLLSHK